MVWLLFKIGVLKSSNLSFLNRTVIPHVSRKLVIVVSLKLLRFIAYILNFSDKRVDSNLLDIGALSLSAVTEEFSQYVDVRVGASGDRCDCCGDMKRGVVNIVKSNSVEDCAHVMDILS